MLVEYVLSLPAIYIGSNMHPQLMWLLFSLTWGTIWLFLAPRLLEESVWGFGQLVSVVLLLLPLLLMVEGFSGMTPSQPFLYAFPFQLLTLLPESQSEISSAGQCTCSVNSRRFGPPTVDSQEQVALMPPRSIEGVGITTQPYNTPSNHERPEPPGNRLCGHIHHLCKQDFRTESWYLDNLRLVALFGVAMAVLILPLHYYLQWNGLLMIEIIFIPIPIGLVAFTTIPLCGIVNSIRSSGSSARHSSFVIKLAIDPSKKYRIIRWIYFLSLPIVSGIAVRGLRIFRDTLSLPTGAPCFAPAGLWLGVGFIVLSSATGSSLGSIYSQVLSRNHCRYTNSQALENLRLR